MIESKKYLISDNLSCVIHIVFFNPGANCLSFHPNPVFARLGGVETRFIAWQLSISFIQVPLLMPQLVVLERQWRFLRYVYQGVVLFFVSSFFTVVEVCGQEHQQQGLLYGRIITVEDQVIEGVLRWGNEEAFWDDLFISNKPVKEDDFTYLSGDELQQLSGNSSESLDWSFWSLWKPRYPEGLQSFRCRFGDLRRIIVTGEEATTLEFKNGQRLDVVGGSSPGKELHIYDRDEVEKRINWGDIRRVEFSATPTSARASQVRPLYGIVFTTQGAFEGFIQWDAQERLTTDLLDGKSATRKVSLPFSEIEEIRQDGDSSLVTLFSGRTYRLGGGDDVGPGNHDIIVKSMELGHVRIPWEQFRFARFYETAPLMSPAYSAFTAPTEIHGFVKTVNGTTYTGKILFDMDERLDLETLEGRKEGIFYHLPIRNIREIIRKNYNVCGVTLRNGDRLFLGQEHDLTDKNWGLLIWQESGAPVYVRWNMIEMIQF